MEAKEDTFSLVIKIIFRIIAFPFVAVIVLIASIRNYLYTCYLWLRYGGELMMHDKVFNPETIREQVTKIKELIDTVNPKN